jgi:8-oxo-dGTP pyrophosphatase MutT (NUDIX family)
MGIDPRETAEARMREILEEAGLPEPDEVGYGDGEIELRRREQKVAVVIDGIPQVDDAAVA